jgi:hypothetical protein
MKRILSFVSTLSLVVVLGFLAGCSDEKPTATIADPPTSGSDEDAIRYSVEEDAEVLGSTQFLGEDEAMGAASPGMSKILEAINTVRWWRTPTSITKTVDVEFVEPQGDSIPSIANVTVTVDAEGVLHLIAEVDDTTRVQYKKPFDDGSLRYATFERRDPPDARRPDRRRGWLLTEISCASIASENSTRQILSVTAAGAGAAFTITDPLALMDVHEDLPIFDRGEDVTVTVVTGDATDRVFLHARGHRFEFENNGDGSFTGTWKVKHDQGVPLHAVGIDVLSGDTLGDDVAPYDSRGWVIPYRVSRPPRP